MSKKEAIARGKDANWCGLKDHDMGQCCCNCKHLKPVHYHCTTDWDLKMGKYKGKCICGIRKSWACVCPELAPRIYDKWPRHSIGCECYDPIKAVGRIAKSMKAYEKKHKPTTVKYGSDKNWDEANAEGRT